MKRILYSRKDCPACLALKEWLKKRRLKYIEKDIDKLENLEEFINNYPNLRTIPVLIIKDKVYSGQELIDWVVEYESFH